MQERDAAFCAAARQDVPALLAELEVVTAERDEARRLLEGLTPGGSEFYDQPERCAQYAADEASRRNRMLVEAKIALAAERVQREKATTLLALSAEAMEEAARVIDAMFPNDEHPGMQNILRAGARKCRDNAQTVEIPEIVAAAMQDRAAAIEDTRRAEAALAAERAHVAALETECNQQIEIVLAGYERSERAEATIALLRKRRQSLRADLAAARAENERLREAVETVMAAAKWHGNYVTVMDCYIGHLHAERAAGRDPEELTSPGWFAAGFAQGVAFAERERDEYRALAQELAKAGDALLTVLEHEPKSDRIDQAYDALNETIWKAPAIIALLLAVGKEKAPSCCAVGLEIVEENAK